MHATRLGLLWQQRAYMRFWFARLAGLTANQMLMVAVGWHMYDLTGSAWDLGLVGLFQFVPALLMALPAGEVADRFHRGRLFAISLGVQVLVAGTLAWSTSEGWTSREWILGLSVLLGLARAFQMPAQQAITPLLVPAHLLAAAITLGTTGVQIAVITGPALGGLIYLGGASAVYSTCTLLLALAVALALAVQHTQPRVTSAVGWRGALEGLVFVWRQKTLLGALSLDLFAVLLGGATALLPIYAKDILLTGPEGLGLLRAAPSAGALCMSVLLVRRPLERHVGHTMLMAVAVFGLATVVFGLSTHLWLSMAALAVAGAADNISVVVRQTIVQLDTPDHIRGRVSAVNGVFIGASNQLGEFESGAVAAWLGPVPAVVLGGVGTVLVAAAWLRVFPQLARRDHLQNQRAHS